MPEIEDLRKEVDKIKQRNLRVEKDKAWETSLTRRIAISAITYILITIFLIIAGVEKPFFASIVPAVAYLISTATLNVVKNWWLKKQD